MSVAARAKTSRSAGRSSARSSTRASGKPPKASPPAVANTARPKKRSGGGVAVVPLMQAFLSNMPGGYTGARYDKREFAEWGVSDSGPHGDLLGDLETLRARSRDLERNEPLAGGAIQTMLDGVVGRGLEPKPRIDRELLGLDEATASAWERNAARIWWSWAGRPGCDLGGRNTFATLTEQVLREALSGGDCLGLRRYAPNKGDLLGLKIQVLEAARISTPFDQVENEFLRAGVQLDGVGRETGFFVSDRYPTERFFATMAKPITWTQVAARDKRGNPLCLHVYRQLRPEQVRGVPYLAPVISLLKQLSRYSNAELMAAVMSSMFTVFVKNAIGGTEGLANIEEEDGIPLPKKDYKMGSGAMVDLEEGEEVEFADPSRPNANFDPFVQAIVRQIGVALGIPFEVLIKHFTASYSAARAALLQAWHTFLTRRSWLVASFCQPAYEWVLDEAIARGLLPAPGWNENPLLRQAWAATQWTGPVMPSLNPVYDVTAAEKRIALTLSTRERETAEMTGDDWEETFAQAKKETEMLRAAGMPTSATPGVVAASANGQQPAQNSGADDASDTETTPATKNGGAVEIQRAA